MHFLRPYFLSVLACDLWSERAVPKLTWLPPVLERSNFRNQMKKWEVETKSIQEQKIREQAQVGRV